MNNEQLAVVGKVIYSKLQEAKTLCKEFNVIQFNFRKIGNEMLFQAFLLGKLLNEMKEDIGHGKWLLYLVANLPELGESEPSIIRNSQRCMALGRGNPNAKNYTQLDPESVRKFLWGYVPPKERLALEGDSSDKPESHPLTAVNYWHKWYRQVKTGQLEALPIETLRHDIGPMLVEGVEMVGKSWFMEQLNGN